MTIAMEGYEDFAELCRKAASDILAGSLKAPPDVSQVGEASWKLLSAINSAGFLTNDSQAGDTHTERAYVAGVMPVESARQFTQRMNMIGDFVALVLEPYCVEFGGTIPVTRTVAPYRDFVKDRRVSKSDAYRAETRIPVYMKKRDHALEIRNLGLKSPSRYRLVQVFDPRWGRPAFKKGNLFAAVVSCLYDAV